MASPDTAAAPDLHLVLAGQRRDPVAHGAGWVFPLHLPAADLRLASRAARPRALGLSQDDRLLGFALTALAVVQPGSRTPIPLDHPAFFEGMHTPEASGLRWTDGNAELPPALFAGLSGAAELHIRGFGLPRYHATPPPAAALMRRFASLGDDCEFGLVQRACDAEPQDLLRWAGTDPTRLVLGLCQHFAGLGDPAATCLEWHDAVQEYRLSDPRYLTAHTWRGLRAESAAAEAELLQSGCARLRLLRRKLLAEIAAAKRIFVFKHSDAAATLDTNFAIHAALRGIGPAPLLCLSTTAHPAKVGTVTQLGEGFFLGHIDRFSRVDIAHDAWHRICATTADLVDATPSG